MIGPDQHGLVKSIANIVAENGGNWLESRLARLSGQFAGVVRFDCPSENADVVISAVRAGFPDTFQIEVVRESTTSVNVPSQVVSIELIANDRPGIVSELAKAISSVGGNIEELETDIENAAHAGSQLFKATGKIALPENQDAQSLINALEDLSADIQVSIL